MRCKRCGEELPERARYCFVCGEPVEDVPAPHRLEEPLDPMAAGAVPMVPVAPPPRAVRIEPRSARVASRPAHPGTAASVAEQRRHAPDSAEHPAGEDPTGAEPDEDSTRAHVSEVGPDRPSVSRRSVRERLAGARERIAASRVPWGVPVAGAVFVVAMIFVLVSVSTSWFGPFAPPAGEAPRVQEPSDGSIAPITADDEEPAQEDDPAEEGPAVREAVEDYSWDELSQISALIAAADSDEEGLEVAERYNLCAPDGTLDGTQTKELELSDGTTLEMRVAAFRADERSDGSGVAGITLIAGNDSLLRPMGSSDDLGSGWVDSDLRAWMNGELVDELPEDLSNVIVQVDKRTNTPPSVGGQKVTADTLWIPSYSEVVGALGPGAEFYGSYDPEGSQYQLFSDLGIRWGGDTSALATGTNWWLRSPDRTSDIRYLVVLDDGTLGWRFRPTANHAVLVSFCL